MRRGARFDQNHTTSHNSIQAPPVELPEETTVLTAPSAETGVSSAGKREQELLRDDVAAWNRLRSSRPEMTVTMKKETLEKDQPQRCRPEKSRSLRQQFRRRNA